MPGFLATSIPFFSALYVGHYLAPYSDTRLGPAVDNIQGVNIVHFGATVLSSADNSSFVLTYGLPSKQPRTSSSEDVRNFLKYSNASDWALIAYSSLNNELILATDDYGTRPIFWADASGFQNPASPNPFAFSSHPSPLHRLGIGPDAIKQVPPNTVLTFAVKPILSQKQMVSLHKFRGVAQPELVSQFTAAALVDQITHLLSGSIQESLARLHGQTSSVLLWTNPRKGGAECDPLFKLAKKVLDTLPVLLTVEEDLIAENDGQDKARHLAFSNGSLTKFSTMVEHLGSMCEP